MPRIIRWKCTVAVSFDGDMHLCLSKVPDELDGVLEGPLVTDYIDKLPKSIGVYDILVETRIYMIGYCEDVDWNSTVIDCEPSKDFIACCVIEAPAVQPSASEVKNDNANG